MFDAEPGRRVLAVGLAGVAVAALGTLLPWVAETRLQVYVLGMDSGLERRWTRALALCLPIGTVAVLAAVGRFDRGGLAARLLAVLGGLSVLVAVLASPLTGRWTPGVGVYVTILGGVLLLVPAASAGSRLLPDAT
ncbi:hypothetical protein [Halorarum halobium]|uniref:hypothetical protein n=1 Tax=Halorarum halobium TaxID=3075121 RepID=UPI0028B15616|nr:hypothetical protein [Halobaculum sp. XH14]